MAAESLPDGLVSEADAEQRDPVGKALDDGQGEASGVRDAGAGGDDNALGAETLDLGQGDLVVAADDNLPAQLTEVLGEVVRKGVVVVEQENH
jgi:hypothetical protein